MQDEVKVRPARTTEIATLARLVETRLPDMMSGAGWHDNVESRLASLVPDQALLVATRGARLAGMIALDIDNGRIIACYLDPENASPDTPKRLFQNIEKVALIFGIRVLRGVARRRVTGFTKSLGYEIDSDAGNPNPPETIEIRKNLLAQADDELKGILESCDRLGIPENYGTVHRMPLVRNASELVEAGRDIFGRDQRLMPAAADAWARMKVAAANAGIDLQLVSAYRSQAYQTNILKKKLDEGQSLKRILRVSAPPGYSEHHSGRAIDLTTHGCKPLEEDFSKTRAYNWLRANARFFGFRESYPRNNRHQLAWEPWHWYYFKT
jgi:LAS superfamily LD-carboxypeptidase LdcB